MEYPNLKKVKIMKNMLKKWIFMAQFHLLGPEPDSESGSTDPIESGSDPDPQHW